jgi:hypothetical protein
VCADEIIEPIRQRVAERDAARDAEISRAHEPPPIPIDAERALLGSMMCDVDIARTALADTQLRFNLYGPGHREILEAIEALAEIGCRADPATTLTEAGDTVTTLNYLEQLHAAADVNRWRDHAAAITAYAQQRLEIEATTRATTGQIVEVQQDLVTDGTYMLGHGQQDGPMRPDYGLGWADLRCDRCAATWVGIINDPCGWCERSRLLLIDAQRAILRDPELCDPADTRYPEQRRQWAQRLVTATAAGICTRGEARAWFDAKAEHCA